MKYYEIKCETPYCGEDNYYYYRSKNDDENAFLIFVDECLVENANEWYDEQAEEDYPEWEDYIASCSTVVREITEEEYYDECPWDKEEE